MEMFVSVLVNAISVRGLEVVCTPGLNWEARKMPSNCVLHLLCSVDGRNAEAQRWPKSQITGGVGVGRRSIRLLLPGKCMFSKGGKFVFFF